MAKKKKPVSKGKTAVAAIAGAFCVVFGVAVVLTTMHRPGRTGPSELARNPDKQDEILAQRKAEDLQKRLELTDEQTAAVTRIITAAKKGAAQLLEEHKGDKNGIIMAAIARRDEAGNEIRKLLTPEQQAKFDEMRGEQRERLLDALEIMRQRGNPPKKEPSE
jgi:Spy/CpxP family protein refolding chaperone